MKTARPHRPPCLYRATTCLAAMLFLGGLLLVPRPSTEYTQSATSTTSAKSTADASGYRPSQFPGVMVRERPSPSPAAAPSRQSSIFVKPGGSISEATRAYRRPAARRAPGRVIRRPDGSVMMYTGLEYAPYMKALKTDKGLTTECIDPQSH